MNVLLNPHQIRMGVLRVTEQIMLDHKQDEPIVLIGVMRGAFMFYADLVQELQQMNVICDFVSCKSYDGTENTGFKMLLDSKVNVSDKHVYIIDDILDSGLTYEFLKIHYEFKGAKSTKGIFVLKKYNEKFKEELSILTLPPNDSRWFIGYGMNDEKEGSRHLKGIYYLA